MCVCIHVYKCLYMCSVCLCLCNVGVYVQLAHVQYVGVAYVYMLNKSTLGAKNSEAKSKAPVNYLSHTLN